MELIQIILLYIDNFRNSVDALAISDKECASTINGLIFIGFQGEIC